MANKNGNSGGRGARNPSRIRRNRNSGDGNRRNTGTNFVPDAEVLREESSSPSVIFSKAVGSIRAQMIDAQKKAAELNLDIEQQPVDLNMKFREVSYEKGGIIFKSVVGESTMEMTLVTRILPPD